MCLEGVYDTSFQIKDGKTSTELSQLPIPECLYMYVLYVVASALVSSSHCQPLYMCAEVFEFSPASSSLMRLVLMSHIMSLVELLLLGSVYMIMLHIYNIYICTICINS